MKKENYIEPKVINNQYVISESVTGGYLNRGEWAHYQVTTTWNKKLELISVMTERDNFSGWFNVNGTVKKSTDFPPNIPGKSGYGDWDFHGRRTVRAVNRHLECIQIYLGMKTIESSKKSKFIYRQYPDWDIDIGEIELTKQGTPNLKNVGSSRYMPATKWTPEKEKLVAEYNINRDKYIKEKDRLFKAIFGD
jgi:hypothetical protein